MYTQFWETTSVKTELQDNTIAQLKSFNALRKAFSRKAQTIIDFN